MDHGRTTGRNGQNPIVLSTETKNTAEARLAQTQITKPAQAILTAPIRALGHVLRNQHSRSNAGEF
jgi:hypothetical protein